MNSKVASSSMAHSDTKTERAPAPKKARAIPMTPSAVTLPRALWQQLRTTSFALSLTACTSAVVKIKSLSSGIVDARPGLGANAISPVSIRPWAAICNKATEVILRNTSSLVAFLPVRGWALRMFPIVSTSCLANGSCDKKGMSLTHGSPTSSTPRRLW